MHEPREEVGESADDVTCPRTLRPFQVFGAPGRHCREPSPSGPVTATALPRSVRAADYVPRTVSRLSLQREIRRGTGSATFSVVLRRVTLAALLAALLLGTMLLAYSAQNDGCLPWQERVGYGDGPLGRQDDFSACR